MNSPHVLTSPYCPRVSSITHQNCSHNALLCLVSYLIHRCRYGTPWSLTPSPFPVFPMPLDDRNSSVLVQMKTNEDSLAYGDHIRRLLVLTLNGASKLTTQCVGTYKVQLLVRTTHLSETRLTTVPFLYSF